MDLHGKILSEGLSNLGHQISFISTKSPNRLQCNKIKNIKMHYLDNTVLGSRREGWRKESVHKFFQLHKISPFDIIWSQSYDAYGMTLIKKDILKVPILLIVHGCVEQELKTFWANCFNKRISPYRILRSLVGIIHFYFFVQKPTFQLANKIITVSKEVQTSIKKYYNDKISNKCCTIVNGVDPNHFAPKQKARSDFRKKFGYTENDIVLLTLGRITPGKGQQVAIDSLRILREQKYNLKMMVVGDGEHLKNLKTKAKKAGLGIDIIFTEFVDNKETVNYYNCADIFLNPTITAEGSSLVLLEAMACGKPTISSNIGGIKSIIDDGKNGLLVPPGESYKLADKIKFLVRQKLIANKLSTSARETILQSFSTQKMVDATLSAIEKTTHDAL